MKQAATGKQTTIGIVGLGKMGRPVGRHLLAAGYAVVGCDPVEAARSEAAKVGITVLDGPAAVGRVADLVLILVGFDNEVEAVLFSDDGILAGAKGEVDIAIGSTISPSYAWELEQRLVGSGVGLIDLPSARGEAALETGDVLLFGGGDTALFEKWRPAFETFASDIFHLGGFGAGQVAKMANNMILWACMSANDEALRLVEKMGVDPQKVREALCLSSAQNWSLTTRAEEKPMPWSEKDMRIALDEADHARISLPLAGTVSEVIKGYKIRNGIPMPSIRKARA
ncbi:NAD(P)-dependent oxidoreductase [Nitratireductor sp. B36]|uniref:NAD(P)-dependent oxidoreductase n=1 Tax=Nitratireductor sp. B36 TaxID=2762059 RepID=UPI001E538B96|nr:NAD(P)-dependent oxidoreductase [Nitratireductor sp. B36]MCC5778404.1 NAD(P)-dependent oxidoreductase [Nitratireductor sp. B36]